MLWARMGLSYICNTDIYSNTERNVECFTTDHSKQVY